MTLTFGTPKALCTRLVDCICQLFIIDYNNFCRKVHCFNVFPYKSIGDQIWPCRKTGQCQSRGTIWINLVVLEYSMLHTKFQVHRPFGSREEDFESLLLYGMAAILIMWQLLNHCTHFHSSIPWRLHVKYGFNRFSVFFEEKKFENVESEWPWKKVNEWPRPLIFM